MPTEPPPLTLSEAVHTAVEVCDDGSSPALADLLERFEDTDEPIAAIEDVGALLDETVGPRVDEDDPAFTMACAVVVYLAYRRDESMAEPDELLTLAARAEFDGEPPGSVTRWLAARGVRA